MIKIQIIVVDVVILNQKHFSGNAQPVMSGKVLVQIIMKLNKNTHIR